MRNIVKNLFFLLLFSSFLFTAKGAESTDVKKKKKGTRQGLAANCTPASSLIFLEFNNVRTRVEAGGLWWQDRPNGAPDYEVPKGSNSFALFAGGLWLAGTDVNGQLKAAASLFGNSVDYWTGPLDTLGLAEIDPETCSDFDKFFEITRAEVAQFRAFIAAQEKGTAAEDFPGYEIPKSILDWPGNGDPSKGQDFRLAPYVNVGGDITYEPELGDYPFYDLEGDIDCRAPRKDRSESSMRPLFGDQTFWWVFNDKGNVHTETNAPPIGMEIHGQAFAFATSDEINDMTFYNFELINRSTFTLTDTYFASYVDPDNGFAFDDYVGCDVARGLGYCYNGLEFDRDARGRNGYGSNPAAVGIDFFEGPFQDADDIDNQVGIGPNEALNGLGYGDGVADNERFGMRRFVYYNNGRTLQNGDPTLAIHYYNYMRGIWKNGQVMRHGGDGFNSVGVEAVPTAFMFPGDSDPLGWGVTNAQGIPQMITNLNWTEDNPGNGQASNPPQDRRFLQSAGPFTLRPGNVNDITVGVVFAQAESGGRLASVEKLFGADDKAQALFDNCFQVLNGPDAPEVAVQELDEELIFYLSNSDISNNREEFGEPYIERDANITTPDNLIDSGIVYDEFYRFQGYQVFQLAGPGISVGDIGDLDKARLVFQADITDGVTEIINYVFDEELQASVPDKKVTGTDEGIRRSFTITEDLFADGVNSLINFKTYYYVAIAYGYNQFKPYAQDVSPNLDNPLSPASDGQTLPYIPSRRGPTGGDIEVITAIPHDPLFEAGGTVVNSSYGDGIPITRLQGRGNGGNAIRLTDATVERLLEEKLWEDTLLVGELDYEEGSGPFTVSIIDPLNVIDGTFYVQLLDGATNGNGNALVTDTAGWKIWREGGLDTVFSNQSIAIESEQLLFNPNWGLSISIKTDRNPGKFQPGNGFISSEFVFDDLSQPWLGGIIDSDAEIQSNWILSGTFSQSQVNQGLYNDLNDFVTGPFRDPEQDFESILNGIIAPYGLTRFRDDGATDFINTVGFSDESVTFNKLDRLNSIVFVITSDKTKWSRCPVLESGNSTNVKRGLVKQRLSVDKDGNPVDTTGLGLVTLQDVEDHYQLIQNQPSLQDEDDAAFTSPVGMGWFPGYVLNKETGERWNIAFGEDTKFSFNNGDDMIWNPTSIFREGISVVNEIWGGKHFVYIFRKYNDLDKNDISVIQPPAEFQMGTYDNGALLKELLFTQRPFHNNWAYYACAYAGIPMLVRGQQLLATDVRIDINVSKPFGVLDSDLPPSLDNNGRPVYRFRTEGVAVSKQEKQVLADALKEINVVPNPYRGISEYEQTQLDNTVKFTNLPEQATIKIYNMNGTLIRSFNKSSPVQFLDWDLKNQVGIPIASGVYIIHVNVPGVGEKILKWFGVLRPVDLNNF